VIIRELKLNPFAGLADQDLKFTQGLNVVVGPNEAGKSTIVNGKAIWDHQWPFKMDPPDLWKGR
jgi:predicted ATP-dependent endonuclease of OLD family